MISNTAIPKLQMVDLQKQYQHIKEEILAGFDEVLSSSSYINGQIVKEFSSNLSNYLNSEYVIPCGNGTDALQAALMALNLKPGDEVITVPFTFVATAEVIALLGLKPVFVDIDPDTYNIDETLIESAISEKTKVILPVHLYGQCANMEAIMNIAEKYNLFVVEDNAQAIGANYSFKNGSVKKSGTIGDIGCTSFYPSKNLGAYGDAGAIFTQDELLSKRLQSIVNHGQEQKYLSNIVGINSRLDSLQAVVLNAKLNHLETYIEARNKVAEYYDHAFSELNNITLPKRVSWSDHVFHQYTINVGAKRDSIKEQLAGYGIPTMIYYPYPLHLHPAYESKDCPKGSLPVSEKLANEVISLPMHTELNEEQLSYICSKFIEVVNLVNN